MTDFAEQKLARMLEALEKERTDYADLGPIASQLHNASLDRIKAAAEEPKESLREKVAKAIQFITACPGSRAYEAADVAIATISDGALERYDSSEDVLIRPRYGIAAVLDESLREKVAKAIQFITACPGSRAYEAADVAIATIADGAIERYIAVNMKTSDYPPACRIGAVLEIDPELVS